MSLMVAPAPLDSRCRADVTHSGPANDAVPANRTRPLDVARDDRHGMELIRSITSTNRRTRPNSDSDRDRPSAPVPREVEAGDVVGGAGGLEGEGAARGVEPDLSGQGRAALLAEDEHVV